MGVEGGLGGSEGCLGRGGAEIWGGVSVVGVSESGARERMPLSRSRMRRLVRWVESQSRRVGGR